MTFNAEFRIPDELLRFVDSGFLKVLVEHPEEKTIEFHMPSMRTEDKDRRVTAYSLVWIHPDFNAQFCHYYQDSPGDLPNFYLKKSTMDQPDEELEGIETLEDLIDWLASHQSRYQQP